MSKIFILNGVATCGKDTFVKYCKEYYFATYHISTITPIKNALKEMYVDINNKDEKTRKLMSDLKDRMTIFNNCSHQYIEKEIEKLNNKKFNYVLFIDSREPDDIEKLCNKFNAKSILIRNSNVEEKFNNHADKNVEEYKYDYYIENDGDLEYLKKLAKNFLDIYG